jgi:hypothetical protein
LQHAKNTKGEVNKGDILTIVELVASALSKNSKGKSTNLYQYLNGEIHEYDHSKVQSAVMKNFVAFVFNPDSLEKLENYLNAKNVDTKWMAYSFWCSFNGFANISRNFVASFFDDSNNKASLYLDNFIEVCFKAGKYQPQDAQHFATNVISTTESNAGKEEKINTFFEKYVNGKYKLSLEQFHSVVSLNDRGKIIDELKNRYRISKKDGVKLIDQFEDVLRTIQLF